MLAHRAGPVATGGLPTRVVYLLTGGTATAAGAGPDVLVGRSVVVR